MSEFKQENRGNINFYNCDNISFMESKPDNYYDLANVDPPYGIGINESIGRRKGDKHSGHKKAYWDNCIPTAKYFELLKRVSKNQIIWGGNYMTDFLSPSPCWLMWDKGFSEDVTFAQFEMAWTSFSSSAKKYDKHPNQKNKIHPTQKPVDLYRWILQRYAQPDFRILDTHGGSHTNAIACDMEGFALDIIEIDQDYFKSGLQAFDYYKRQLKLF